MGDDEIYIVRWTYPRHDAVVPLLCEYCGSTLYSSAENIKVAKERGMQPCCVPCLKKLMAENHAIYGGRVRDGAVIENREKTEFNSEQDL